MKSCCQIATDLLPLFRKEPSNQLRTRVQGHLTHQARPHPSRPNKMPFKAFKEKVRDLARDR